MWPSFVSESKFEWKAFEQYRVKFNLCINYTHKDNTFHIISRYIYLMLGQLESKYKLGFID